MRIVPGGVDTHAGHVAAAIDHNGGLLGVEFPATDQPAMRVCWAGWSVLVRVVEGTGSWGVGSVPVPG